MTLPATPDRDALPRLSDDQLAELLVVASAPLPVLPPCEPKHFNRWIGMLDAALPRQHSGGPAGKLKLAAYQHKLGHMPREQIDFICDAALEECRWFPSIAELLDIAKRWQRPDLAQRDRARRLIEQEDNARLSDLRRRLRFGEIEQAEVDALPAPWVKILAAENYLHRDPDRFGQIKISTRLVPPAFEDHGDG